MPPATLAAHAPVHLLAHQLDKGGHMLRGGVSGGFLAGSSVVLRLSSVQFFFSSCSLCRLHVNGVVGENRGMSHACVRSKHPGLDVTQPMGWEPYCGGARAIPRAATSANLHRVISQLNAIFHTNML